MTRKHSSPMGLEVYLPVLLAFIMMPFLSQAAPFQEYTEIQQYTDGCYYNYNHYNEGDRIMTNEPCLNCTCHNKMLMCYLRVCPFTKPIGHDCIVEKREDQCCPIITCPEVPVDVAHAVAEPSTELTFPEKFGCSIDGKFYLEGAQVPSNPSKPCELCYCIKNRTSCLMQECTLHIDGCTPIYNKGSCCPVRYNCDHENDVLELEDHSTTTEAATTTERPTTGFIISSTMSPSVSTDCVHNGELYSDGARILGETACENCYCMRGEIICAVQECQMPMLNGNGKSCHALPPAEGECCPSNYVCEDDSTTTQITEASTLPYDGIEEDVKASTTIPVKDLHSGIPEEDLQLQTHIDEEEIATKTPATESQNKEEAKKDGVTPESVNKSFEEHEAITTVIADVHKPTESVTMLESEDKTEGPKIDSSEAAFIKPTSEEESITTIPIAADILPTATEKSESVEIATKAPSAGDLDTHEETKISTEPTEEDETKSVLGDENGTSSSIFDEEISSTKAPVAEQHEHTVEASHEDVTKDFINSEQATGNFEEHSTEASLTMEVQEAEQITETSTESKEKEQESSVEGSGEEDFEQTTKVAVTEEESLAVFTENRFTVTTVAPKEIEEEISTEEPKESAKPEEEYNISTESDEESKPQYMDEFSTVVPAIEKLPVSPMSTESESEIAFTTSVSVNDGQESVTTALHIKEDENKIASSEYVPTKTPTSITSDSNEEEILKSTDAYQEKEYGEASGEGKPLDSDKQEPDYVTDAPKEEHTVTSAIFDDEFGSGDLATEVSAANDVEPQTVSSTEGVSSILETQHKEEEHMTEGVVIEDRLSGEEPTTSIEMEEPAESEEDTKIMDLTTAKISEEHVDVTTIKTLTADITTSVGESSGESTEETENEYTSTKTIIDEEQPDEMPAKKVETEKPTTQKANEDSMQQTTSVPTANIDLETDKKDQHKTLPESSDHITEQPTEITDSPMDIIEDTETQTQSETDKERDIESTTIFSTNVEDEATSTTVKAFIEVTHVEEIPDMQLPSVIPGEGDCLVGQKTYQNNSIVPTSDECEIICKCVSSIVSCKRVSCSVPENIEKCVLDKSSTNKCCPSYICATDILPSKIEDITEATEQEENKEENTRTTTSDSHKVSEQPTVSDEREEESESTTVKLSVAAKGDALSIIIPEIEMPIASTEEPMSHVKDEEEEFEHEAIKSSIGVIAEDKKETYAESELSTTPSAVVEDIIVPQSMSPVKISEHDQSNIVTDKIPIISEEKEINSTILSGQQQPEKELHEETTFGFIENVPDSSTSSVISSADENQTLEPIEKEKEPETSEELIETTGKPIVSQDVNKIPASEEEEKSETDTQTVISTSTEHDTTDYVSPAEKESEIDKQTTIPIASEPETHSLIPSISSEEDEVPVTPEHHTTIHAISNKEEANELTQVVGIQTPIPFDLEKETQTSKTTDIPTLHSEDISEDNASSDDDEHEETIEEIQISTSIPIKNIKIEEELQQPSINKSMEDESDATTDLENISHTTELASIIEDKTEHSVTPSIAEEESSELFESISSSTGVSVSEKEQDEHKGAPAPEESEEDISATTASAISSIIKTEEQKQIGHDIVSGTSLEGEEYLEHTVTPAIQDELREDSNASVMESSTSAAPVKESEEDKLQTPALILEEFPITPTSAESPGEGDEEDIQVTSKPISGETPSEPTEIVTEKLVDVTTKNHTSSSVPHMTTSSEVNVLESTSSTLSAMIEENEEEASSTDKLVTDQTEATPMDHEKHPTVVPTSSESLTSVDKDAVLGEDINKENITIPSLDVAIEELEPSAHTMAPPELEEIDHVTKYLSITDDIKTEEDIENVTKDATISSAATEEVSTETAPIEKDESDTQRPVFPTKGLTSTIASVDIESNNTTSKHPSLDLSEEASGESEESEEEIRTEHTEIQNVTEFVTERIEESTVKPSEAEVSTENENEISRLEGEIEELPSLTTKPYQSIDEEIESSTESEVLKISADKLPKDEISPVVTKAPEGTTDVTQSSFDELDIEDVTAQGPKEQDLLISSVTTEPLTLQELEDTSTQEPESVTASHSFKNIANITAHEPEREEVILLDHDSSAGEGMEGIRESEQDTAPVTIAPITVTTAQHFEDHDTSAITNAPLGMKETIIVTAKQPDEEEKDVLEQEGEENISSTTQTSVTSEEIVNVTTEPDDIREENIITTAKLPTDKEADNIQKPSNQLYQEEEIVTPKPQISESIDDAEASEETIETSNTTKVAESLEEAEITTKLFTSQQGDELFDITTSSIIENESDEEHKKRDPTISEEEQEAVEPTTAKLPELADHVTEPSSKYTESEETKEEYPEFSTELPVDSHISTESSTKVTVSEGQAESTELPAIIQEPRNITESEQEESTETILLTNKLTEAEKEANKDTTDLSLVGTEATEKLTEYVTKMPIAGIHSTDKQESQDETTAASVEADRNTNIPFEHVESEEVEKESSEKPTELPIDKPVSVDELPGRIKELEEESSELPEEVQVTSDMSSEHSTELPVRGTGQEKENAESYEKATDLGLSISTDKLPEILEHMTELSIDSVEPEMAEHVTDLPAEIIKTEDEEKIFYEESTNLPENVTKMPIKDAKPESTEPTDELSEIPEDHVSESEAETHKKTTELPIVVPVYTDNLLEVVTELPTKDIEPEEKPQELPIDVQEIPTKDTKTEYDLSVEAHGPPELEAQVTELPAKDVESEEDFHEKATELPIVVAHDISTIGQAVDRFTETVSKEEESTEATALNETTEEITDDRSVPTSSAYPVFPHLTTVAIDTRIDDKNLTFTSHSTTAPLTPTTTTTSTTSTTTTEPITTTAPHHYQPQPPIYGQPPQYGPTQYEDEYTDEDEGEVFGPGTCRYGGKLYVSAQQIPRDDPCDFCFCFRSDIICLQQSCPPPIAGCHEEPISGFCCPRYECPVSMATVLNITTSTTTTSTTLPPHFLHHSYGNNVQRNGCLINGRSYRVGEKIESTSGPCINCTCGGDGQMKCDPQACVPEPTMQQVMAVVAAGRKR